jgi:hypothetical protein
MRPPDRALRALLSQVQFEIVRTAAEVVQAAGITARAASRVEALERRADTFLLELRQISSRPRLNAALLDTMRRCHRAEQTELRDWQVRRRTAWQQEQQVREALAGLRHQERSLERALQAERRKRELRVQALDMIRADELWLQHSMRESA